MNDHINDPADTALWIENHPFDELHVGASATLQRTLTKSDILLFAKVSGDVNPAHVDAVNAKTTRFGEIIAHGMLGGSLISTVLGTQFPGPGTIYVGQTLRFLRPVHPGDTLTVTVTVASLDPVKHRALLDTRCLDQDGKILIDGQAEVVPPSEKLRIRRTDLPDVLIADKTNCWPQLRRANRSAWPWCTPAAAKRSKARSMPHGWV